QFELSGTWMSNIRLQNIRRISARRYLCTDEAARTRLTTSTEFLSFGAYSRWNRSRAQKVRSVPATESKLGSATSNTSLEAAHAIRVTPLSAGGQSIKTRS